MDIATLIARMAADGYIDRLARSVTAQFGTPQRRYIGAELLPERPVDENEYTEYGIRWRTVVATDKTRYSPVELREGKLTGSFKVGLTESGTGDQLTARDFDHLRRLLGRGDTVAAMAQLIRWNDTSLLRPLVEKCEVKRWQFLAEGQVKLRGANEYSENIDAPVIAGQRAVAGGDWTDPTYDPFLDIYERVQYLTNKGYRTRRIITSSTNKNKLLNNEKVAARFGRIIVGAGGTIGSASGRPTLAAVNGILAEDNIPGIETYDLMYQTMTGQQRFLRGDVMVFVAETDQQESILNTNPDGAPIIIPNTLGYYAIGVNAGRSAPGRVIINRPVLNEIPPHVEGEAAQTEFPVVMDPEAFCTLTGI